ncbi:MAG TPA: tannase/feruloyl esterase family alpha/beta hydrolase [Paracoccaceae bacterium]|nr:tannase/feruloyl esterase family alpha/beta hydrolase [Paracoccaceae bacterium]
MAAHVPAAAIALAATLVSLAGTALAAADARTCAALRGLSIAPAAIGAPSSGADISEAEIRALEGGAEYCRVTGHVDPVDPAAPDINFEVNLPLDWNGKAVQFGGGGYNGTVPDGTRNVAYGADEAPTPLQRGYVTLGSDSGHQSPPPPLDGRFMLNDEALANFGGLQIKKTHDVAIALIRAFYEAAPERFYFQGSSQGGHEALIAIQRWPGDYDGAIVVHPANPFTALQLSGNRAGQALYAPGAWVGPAEVELLNAAVTAACDGLDGAEDGLISHTSACAETFDVQSLRCPSGGDEGESCLSDAQIAALDLLNSRYQAPWPLQGGATGFARWPIYEGADLYGLWGMGKRPEPSIPPSPVQDFGLAVLADPLIRFAFTRDPAFNSLTFRPEEYRDRILEVSELLDSSQADLSPFADRGAKMLLMHGTTDFAISPHNSTEYYLRIVEAMGEEKVRGFLRYYLVPGFGHGSGRFKMRWDPLTALENWVEQGIPPANLVTADAGEEHAGRTRPLCEYPAFPRLNEGATDLAAAASFTCATE